MSGVVYVTSLNPTIIIINFFSDDRRLKRVREEPEDSESYEKHSRREDESSKVDPRDVPDPESVAGWSDESIKGICSNLFVLPEENKSVTLNPCKQS